MVAHLGKFTKNSNCTLEKDELNGTQNLQKKLSYREMVTCRWLVGVDKGKW